MNQAIAYEPFADLFPEIFRGLTQTQSRNPGAAGNIRMNVTESDNEYVVHAELPGMTKDQIAVEIDGNRVSISTENNALAQDVDGVRVLRRELSRGVMKRRFEVALEIDEDASNASFENGVLTLTLPKKAAATARRLEIA